MVSIPRTLPPIALAKFHMFAGENVNIPVTPQMK